MSWACVVTHRDSSQFNSAFPEPKSLDLHLLIRRCFCFFFPFYGRATVGWSSLVDVFGLTMGDVTAFAVWITTQQVWWSFLLRCFHFITSMTRAFITCVGKLCMYGCGPNLKPPAAYSPAGRLKKSGQHTHKYTHTHYQCALVFSQFSGPRKNTLTHHLARCVSSSTSPPGTLLQTWDVHFVPQMT